MNPIEKNLITITGKELAKLNRGGFRDLLGTLRYKTEDKGLMDNVQFMQNMREGNMKAGIPRLGTSQFDATFAPLTAATRSAHADPMQLVVDAVNTGRLNGVKLSSKQRQELALRSEAMKRIANMQDIPVEAQYAGRITPISTAASKVYEDTARTINASPLLKGTPFERMQLSNGPRGGHYGTYVDSRELNLLSDMSNAKSIPSEVKPLINKLLGVSKIINRNDMIPYIADKQILHTPYWWKAINPRYASERKHQDINSIQENALTNLVKSKKTNMKSDGFIHVDQIRDINEANKILGNDPVYHDFLLSLPQSGWTKMGIGGVNRMVSLAKEYASLDKMQRETYHQLLSENSFTDPSELINMARLL